MYAKDAIGERCAIGTTDEITVEGIGKRFGSTIALDDVHLTVPRGTVFGLLGPNGAGKTTLVRILTTLLRPDHGRAVVAGYDVVHDAAQLRSVIGLAGQYAAVDETLTGRENLKLVARLYHLPRREWGPRAEAVLERFSLTDAADRPVRTYSGGMRRRLDLGASLVGRPRVLILDEPTTGLDPRTRMELWVYVEDLVRDGVTVLLTTQYLEEAERLAARMAVLDQGKVIAEGTANELKDRLGGAVLEVAVADPKDLERARELLVGVGSGAPSIDPARNTVSVAAHQDAQVVLDAAARLLQGEVPLQDIALRRPSLDDVFLALTGNRTAVEPAAAQGPKRWGRRSS